MSNLLSFFTLSVFIICEFSSEKKKNVYRYRHAYNILKSISWLCLKEKKRVIFLFSKLVMDVTLEKSVNHNYTAHIAVERIKK